MPQALSVELEDLAEFLADDYFPDSHVEPEKIANANDISVSHNHYGNDFDGILEHDSGRFHVYVNVRPGSNRNSPRSRFTLCHELGHYFIDAHRLALMAGSTPTHKSKIFLSDSPVEIQADFFASNLLMPKSRVLKVSRKSGRGLETVLRTAEAFKASITASAVRYVSLELSEAILVKWDDSGINWKRLSQSVWEKRYRRILASLSSLPEDSATRMALDNATPQSQFFSGTTTASIWLPGVSSSSDRRNIILNEHSMRLGKYGGITLLTPYDGEFN